MFIRTLSQSQRLSVLSTDRLYEVLERLGESSSQQAIDIDMAAIVAQEANVEALVSGNISKEGDSLRINVKVYEPNQGQVLKEESVEGSGLEAIFGMVDHLTQRIKGHLQLSTTDSEPSKGIADLSTNSLEAWRHYTSGVDFFNKYLFPDAVLQFEKAIALDSTFVMPHLRLIEGYTHVGNIDERNKTYEKLQSLRDYANERESYRIDYFEATAIGDLPLRIEILQKLSEKYPNDREAIFELGSLYQALHNDDDAIKYLQKVLSIDPKFKLALNQLGYAYAFAGDFNKAIATLNKYKELAKDEPNPYDSLGEIYLFMGDYKQAEKHFKRALKINEDFIFSLNNLASVYTDKGDFKKAQKTLEKYLEKVSDGTLKAAAYAAVARIQWRSGEMDQATANFQKSLDNNIFDYWVAKRIHEIYLENGETAKAHQFIINHYDRIKDAFSSNMFRNLYSTLLARIALWHDVRIGETIDALQAILAHTDNPALKSRIRLLLTLLYHKANRRDDIENKWNKYPKSEIVDSFRESYNLTYSGFWRFFSLLNHTYYHNIDAGIRDYNALIEYAIDKKVKLFEVGLRILLTDLYFQKGDQESGQHQLKTIGMPEEADWMVIGPFDNKNGFQRKFPPEKQIDLNKVYKDKSEQITWHHSTDDMKDGFIDLRDIFDQSNWSVAYGLIYIMSPDNRNVQLRIGSNESVKVWLNDREIFRFNQFPRLAILDDNIVNVTLKPGLNKVLLKVCNRVGIWGFYFRVTNDKGNGIPDIQFVPPDALEEKR